MNNNKLNSVLVSGGGAFNGYLIEVLRKKFNGKIHIPDEQTINFKEALIFAFLGYLRLHNRINTLSSVTGAVKNSIGGAVYSGHK
jgi:anhydro-N-acetylmuramic acid kinase